MHSRLLRSISLLFLIFTLIIFLWLPPLRLLGLLSLLVWMVSVTVECKRALSQDHSLCNTLLFVAFLAVMLVAFTYFA